MSVENPKYNIEDESIQKNLEIKTKRNDEGIIEYYIYIEHKKGVPPFITHIQREEAERIYRLYPNEGSGFTQKQLAREFPNIPFDRLRKIIKAFGITKADLSLPPHILEEKTTAEASEIAMNHKKLGVWEHVNANRDKVLIQELRKVTKDKINDEKWVELLIESFANENFSRNYVKKTPLGDNSYDLNIYLSDVHVGAIGNTLPELGKVNWGLDAVKDRLSRTLDHIVSLCGQYKNIRTIRVLELGDGIDGFNNMTTRGGHYLPQNMDNIEQVKSWLEIQTFFMNSLHELGLSNNIEYYSTSNSNHSGIVGYILNTAFKYILKTLYPDMKVHVSDQDIDHFHVDDKFTFIYTHGKDDKNMTKGFPLNPDDRTRRFFDEYIMHHKINKDHKIQVVKGDTHVSSFTELKYFRYRSCIALFPGTSWQKINFGLSTSGVSIDLLSLKDKMILTSDIILD